MAEVMFKLLRCDAEASHLLGWAKKEVRRLVDHAKLEAFQRTWLHGDVSVRAHYFGGLARLWLEAAESAQLWFGFGVKLGMPSARGVSIIRRQPPGPSYSWRSEPESPAPPGTCLWKTYTDYSYEGVQFSTSLHEVNNCGSPIVTQTFQDSNAEELWSLIYGVAPPLLSVPPAGLYLPMFSGTYTHNSSTVSHSLTGAYGDRAVPAPITAYGTVEVRLTDGTLLASAPHKRFYNAINAAYIYQEQLRLYAHVSNQPKQEQEWSGGGVIPLYDRIQTVWTPSQTLSFDVPADVAAPAGGIGDWNDPNWYYDQTYIYFNDTDGVLVGGSLYDGAYNFSEASPWAIAWRSGREQVVVRERARRLTASNALLDSLRAKEVTAEVKTFLKHHYPRSERAVRTSPLRIVSGPTYTRTAQTTTVVSVYYSYVSYERWEGRCTLAYTTIEDEVEVEHTKEYVGYYEWHKPVVALRTPMGNTTDRHEYYTEYTYDNIPLLNSYGSAFFGVPVQGLNYVQHSETIKDIIANGTAHIHDELFEPLFGTLSGTVTYCPSWIPTDANIFGFYPTYTKEVGLVTPSPKSEVDVVFDHTAWFKEYLNTAGRVKNLVKNEGAPPTRTQFLSSSLARNTAIKVVPLSAMAVDEERGLFPYPQSDLYNQHASGTPRLITGLKIYGYASVTYDAATDAFAVSAWTELEEPKVLDIVALEAKYGRDLSSWLNTNCVCLGGVVWDDLKDAAKEQRADVKAPGAFVGNDIAAAEICLYAEVKAALTPPE